MLQVDLDDFIAKQCVNIKEQPGLPYADFIKMISFHAGGYDSDEAPTATHSSSHVAVVAVMRPTNVVVVAVVSRPQYNCPQ